MPTGPSTTSSPRPWTQYRPTVSSANPRSSCARSSQKPRLRPRQWSKRKLPFGAGVAHLVERNLPKVEVAGSRPVARSNSQSMNAEVRTLERIANGGFEIENWDEKPAGVKVGPKVT